VSVPLAPWEAVLGTKLQIPTIDGKIKLNIPANSPAGLKLRIKGKGLNTKTVRGDLFAIVKIVVPLETNDESKKLWERLSDVETFNPREAWSKQS